MDFLLPQLRNRGYVGRAHAIARRAVQVMKRLLS
jgi:hypothetical protein